MSLYETDKTLYPDLIWDAAYAPILGHWRLVFNGIMPDLAVWRNADVSPAGVTALLVVCGLLILGACWGLYRCLSNPQAAAPARLPRWGGVLTLIALALPALMMTAYRLEPRYFADRNDLEQARAWLEEHTGAGDVLVVRSYLYPVWHYWMNAYRGETPWYSLPIFRPPGDGEPVDELENGGYALFDQIIPKHRRILLLCELFEADEYPTRPERFLNTRYRLETAVNFTVPDQDAYVRLLIYEIP